MDPLDDMFIELLSQKFQERNLGINTFWGVVGGGDKHI